MGIMCKVMRGECIESMHVAYGVAVGENGTIIEQWGDPYYLTCIRSALKPFQASASVAKGATAAAGFNEQELALMCASHNGEDIHVNTARAMLEKLGYDITYYECGSHPPYDAKTRNHLLLESLVPSPLHNNCSGKHAGMLSLAKHLNIDPKGYTDIHHPVQEEIMKKIKQFAELDHFPLAVDGCSAPVPFLPLYHIALMYQKLGSGKFPELNTLYQAMINHPMMIGGTERFDTDFIAAMNGTAITKVGGEAVRGVTVKCKNGSAIGIALKVLDGNQRCLPMVTLKVLEKLDLISEQQLKQMDKYIHVPLTNHRNLQVGKIAVELP